MKKLLLFLLLFTVVFCGFSQTDDTTRELLRTTEKILDVVTQQSDSARAASIRVTTNEIGLDMFDLALLRTVDITYEYVKNSEFGFGLTARFCLDSNASNGIADNEKYDITPFVRYYFFNKQDYGSKGFYTEIFLKFYGGDCYRYDYGYDYDYSGYYASSRKDTYLDAAFGVGLGYKYVNRRGFVVDLNIGLGRSLGLSEYINDNIVGRGGIVFGYRF